MSPNTRYVIDYVYNQVTKLAEIYLDGVQIASGTKNWNEKVLDGYISVGDESHTSTVNAFQGTLHEVSMYDCGGRSRAGQRSVRGGLVFKTCTSGCGEISRLRRVAGDGHVGAVRIDRANGGGVTTSDATRISRRGIPRR